MLAPVTFGATVFKGAEVARDGLPAGSAGPFAVGIAAAAVSGLFAISFLLRYVRTHSYDIFVWYRFAVATLVLGLIGTGVKEATF
jgi:undecaprenyl-diphosphatase